MDDFELYRQVWVNVLHHLMLWPIEDALAWTEQYSHRRDGGMLYHETPIFHVVREILPRERVIHLSFEERRRLTREIENVFLDRDIIRVIEADYDWGETRAAIDEVINRFCPRGDNK